MRITDNFLQQIQLSGSKDGQAQILSTLNKLFQSLKFTSNDIQNLRHHFNIKEIFTTLINTFHQVEIIARNVMDEGATESKQKSSPAKQERYILSIFNSCDYYLVAKNQISCNSPCLSKQTHLMKSSKVSK